MWVAGTLVLDTSQLVQCQEAALEAELGLESGFLIQKMCIPSNSSTVPWHSLLPVVLEKVRCKYFTFDLNHTVAISTWDGESFILGVCLLWLVSGVNLFCFWLWSSQFCTRRYVKQNTRNKLETYLLLNDYTTFTLSSTSIWSTLKP